LSFEKIKHIKATTTTAKIEELNRKQKKNLSRQRKANITISCAKISSFATN